MEESIRKADVLIEALPYIKAFHKKITVIKYGGSILGEDTIRKGVLEDIVFLSFMGLRPILIHGGGPNISERMKRQGKKTDFVDGMRVTDSETLKIVEEELEELNQKIVEEIKAIGGKAKGLSGKDEGIVWVRKKKGKQDLGFVGEVIKIDTKSIIKEVNHNVIPVVCPMGKGTEDKRTYNVNADEVAAHISIAVLAEKLVILTNVKGIIRDQDNPHSFLSTLTINEAKDLIKDNVIQEGMVPKVEACIRAIEKGVKKSHIIDARISHSLLLEIFTDKGIGTGIIH